MDRDKEKESNDRGRGSFQRWIHFRHGYWETKKKEKYLSLNQRVVVLGHAFGRCNLGISYLQVRGIMILVKDANELDYQKMIKEIIELLNVTDLCDILSMNKCSTVAQERETLIIHFVLVTKMERGLFGLSSYKN